MSGLAMVLIQQGHSVSGSDTANNSSIRKLKRINVQIYNEQKSINIKHLKKTQEKEIIIIISSAISKTNAELEEAYNQNLKILHRSDILSYLINRKKSILIAGSHGKTTTSTLITTIIANNNYDPTAIVGGIVPLYKSNAYSGKGELLIAEIDESDGSITKYIGNIAILTNIELDHTDHYINLKSLIKSINIFARNSQLIIANYDCPNLKKYLSCKAAWWSTKSFKEVEFSAIPTEMDGTRTTANYYEKGELIDKITISIPGLHNLNNTVAAIAACRTYGLSFLQIKKELCKLESPKRRFEFKGVWNNRQIVDDYAHHPTEVRETISMARLLMNSKKSFLPIKPKRLVIIFQGHRYSRLRDLIKDFAINLSKADFLLLAPIYSAGETAIKGINNESLKSLISANNPSLSILNCKTMVDVKNMIEKTTKPNDLIVVMGAGDINKLSTELLNKQE